MKNYSSFIFETEVFPSQIGQQPLRHLIQSLANNYFGKCFPTSAHEHKREVHIKRSCFERQSDAEKYLERNMERFKQALST